MDGWTWGLLVKPLAVVAILLPWVYLSRLIDWADDRLPDSWWKRILFKRVGNGADFADPIDDPGRYQRQRDSRKRQQNQQLPRP
jgi:hypothetical protein